MKSPHLVPSRRRPAQIEILESRIAPAFGAVFNLATLTGVNGTQFNGESGGDQAGGAVSAAGDINGDGIGDIIVGAAQAGPNGLYSGASYVVFGKVGGLAANFELSSLNGSNGFKIPGSLAFTNLGYAVSAAGDLNGDGIDDLAVSAFQGGTGSRGAVYVIFGSRAGFAPTVTLGSLTGSNGFELLGEANNDFFGSSVGKAGDVNADGIDDLIVGAPGNGPGGNTGAAYVLFGTRAGFAPSSDVSTLSGFNGFKLVGAAQNSRAGVSVAGVGDVNADGFDDIIVGADGVDGAGGSQGQAYVIFGKKLSFASSIGLGTLGSDGFEIKGEINGDQAGFAVSRAGDINGDGISDILIGANHAAPNGANSGKAYVVFGAPGLTGPISLLGLTGANGFSILGEDTGNQTGRSVAGLGDVNGDGIDDLLVGAPYSSAYGSSSGMSYIVYGKRGGFSTALSLSTLTIADGVRIHGEAATDALGRSVGGRVDFNGDGISDLLIGAFRADVNGTDSGAAYIIYGQPLVTTGSFPGNVDLTTLAGANGFKLSGAVAGDNSGYSVSGAGDINGDGFADLIIGDFHFQSGATSAGASYVVFGSATGFPANLDLSTLNGSNGFKIGGDVTGAYSNTSVSRAGDINGDGIDDLIIGSNRSDPNGSASGASYVVFGSRSGFSPTLDLTTLTGSNGFKISGELAGDYSGTSVKGVGDINGDGIADLIVGAYGAAPHGSGSGAAYVVFGSRSGFGANLDLSTLTGSNGFKLSGEGANDFFGSSASGAGDINGDGIDDLIIGARNALANGIRSGAAYVVFGSLTAFAANLDVSTLTGVNGFKINGGAVTDSFGQSVGRIGDMNGDGIDDVVIGAELSGASYVLFGTRSGFAASFDISTLSGGNGFKISGPATNDKLGHSVSGAGDINGDGINDVIVGAYGSSANGSYSGATYVVFGSRTAFPANLNLSTLVGNNGFKIAGVTAGDSLGSVGAAGDINGDGVADLIIGAFRASPNGTQSGASYVVFGQRAVAAAPTMPQTEITLVGGNLVISDIVSGGHNDLLSLASDTGNGFFVIADFSSILTATGVVGAIVSPDQHTVTVPFSTVTGTTIFVNTTDGDDILGVDLSLGAFALAINYAGGPNVSAGDTLHVFGGPVFTSVAFNYVDSNSGSISVAGNSLITYSEVESIFSTISAQAVTLNFGASIETIDIGAGDGSGSFTVGSTAGGTTTFLNPSSSLTINGGGGNDRINLNSIDSLFSGALTIDGQGGNANTVVFDPTLSGGLASLVVRTGTGGDIQVNGMLGAVSAFLDSGSGTISFPGGSFSVTSNDAFGANSLLQVSGGTLDIESTAQHIGGLRVTAGSITGVGSITSNTAYDVQSGTISPVLSGNVGLTKTTPGTVTLSGANDYFGNTTVNEGTLEFAAVGSTLSSRLKLGGGTVKYSFPSRATINPTVTLTADSTIEVAAGLQVNWGNLTALNGGAFTIHKTGPGVLVTSTRDFDVAKIQIDEGALGTSRSNGFGNAKIKVAVEAALWTIGNITLSNDIVLDGADGTGVLAPESGLGGLRTVGGDVAVFTGKITLASGINTIGTDGGDIIIRGAVGGAGLLSHLGPGTLALKNAANSFGPGDLTLSGGVLEVASNGALGKAANSIVLDGGSLRVTAGFATLRHISLPSGNATIEVPKGLTLSLNGLVDGIGTLEKAGGGTLIFGGAFVGDTVVMAGNVTVNGTFIDVSGLGQALVHTVIDGTGKTRISTIELTSTDGNSKLVVKGKKTTIDRIISANPMGDLRAIILGTGILLGDGVADNIPDLAISGRVGKLKLYNIAPNAILRLGDGLAYNVSGDQTTPDTYNNHPTLKINNVKGPGVVVDVTGDGTPGGVGGGGLDVVVIKKWDFPGLIKTTQSVTSYTLLKGDSQVVFEIDKFGNGAGTIASMGDVVIARGSWGSSGSEIEGSVGSFQATAFLEGATLAAGSIEQLKTKSGPFAGTLTLTDPMPALLGKFRVNSDFTGFIDAVGPVKNVIVNGDFTGSLRAQVIGSITAYSFNGTTTNDRGVFGDPLRQNIVATGGSIGAIVTTAGGIKDYEIVASTLITGVTVVQRSAFADLAGLDHVLLSAQQIGETSIKLGSRTGADLTGISESVFSAQGDIGKVKSSHGIVESDIAAGGSLGFVKAASIADSQLLAGVWFGADNELGGGDDVYSRAAKIAAITIVGAMKSTNVIVGLAPGSGGVFGDGNDVAAPGSPLAGSAIGPIKLGSASGAIAADTGATLRFSIAAASIASITIGGKTVTDFSTPQVMHAPGIPNTDDTAVRLI